MTDRASIPSHVPPERVFEFDIFADPRLSQGIHDGYMSLHQSAPDIFFSPENGGHWMVTRYDLMNEILTNPALFSSRQRLPRTENPFQMIPLNLDPPAHTPYRIILMRYFSPKVVASLETKIRSWAVRLIDAVVQKGEANFSEELASVFPVSIFMELMGLPLERLREFRTIVVEYFGPLAPERRVELENVIHDIMRSHLETKRQAPGEDLASRLLSEQIDGRPLSEIELKSMTFLLFVGGIDTVANQLMFAFQHLAQDRALQQHLGDNPERIPLFIDEALRRYTIIQTTRMLTADAEFHGVRMLSGDMVVCSNLLAGLDATKNPDPRRFDLDRKGRAHFAFSGGPHVCVGQFLARAEMRIFVEEWLKRVPQFNLAEGYVEKPRPGLVSALADVELSWSGGSSN